MPDKKTAPIASIPPVSTVREIPLYLIPRVVADQINEKRESVFQIAVTRSNWHYYTVVVTTSDVRQAPPLVSCSPEPAVQERWGK